MQSHLTGKIERAVAGWKKVSKWFKFKKHSDFISDWKYYWNIISTDTYRDYGLSNIQLGRGGTCLTRNSSPGGITKMAAEWTDLPWGTSEWVTDPSLSGSVKLWEMFSLPSTFLNGSYIEWHSGSVVEVEWAGN